MIGIDINKIIPINNILMIYPFNLSILREIVLSLSILLISFFLLSMLISYVSVIDSTPISNFDTKSLIEPIIKIFIKIISYLIFY